MSLAAGTKLGAYQVIAPLGAGGMGAAYRAHDLRLPGPSINDMFAMSPDNSTIYYGAARSEADIWIVERK